VHAFDVLGDPVRRRILELLADGERAAGEVGAVVQEEFGITQPAVSMHLRVLRDSGFVAVRAEGARRLYAVAPGPFQEVDRWLDRYRRFWAQPLDALATELARGQRERRRGAEGSGQGQEAGGEHDAGGDGGTGAG
jgi:DNA-binding transcriptional ArsR family regulator